MCEYNEGNRIEYVYAGDYLPKNSSKNPSFGLFGRINLCTYLRCANEKNRVQIRGRQKWVGNGKITAD
jgi:hypothetical protein